MLLTQLLKKNILYIFIPFVILIIVINFGMAAANFNTVTVNLGPAIDINYAKTSEGNEQKISLNNSNNAIAVWREQSSETISQIFSRTFNENRWSNSASLLNNNQNGSAANPQIALNDAGTAIAVWTEADAQSATKAFSRIFNGSTWASSAISLNNDQNNNADSPQIALNSTGTAIAVWLENAQNIAQIFSRVFNGTSWASSAHSLNASPYDSSSPRIVIDDTGNAIAIWSELYHGLQRTRSTLLKVSFRFFDGTSWSNYATISNNMYANAYDPQIAINSTGTAAIMWIEESGTNNTVLTSIISPSAGARPITINNNPNKSAGVIEPYITFNNNNFSIATWSEEGSPFNVFARQTAIPYIYTQWLSSVQGIKKYIAASTYNDDTNQSTIDIYKYNSDIDNTDFKTSITIDGPVYSFAVYNKADNDLRLALIIANQNGNGTLSNSILQTWKFNGTSAILTADLSSYLSEQIIDAQWWATSQSQSYLATISQNVLTILDLVDLNKTTSLSLSDSIRLLWTTKNDYTGLVILQKTGSISQAIPCKVDFSTNPITITPGTGITAPDGLSFYSISTCGDYIAVGFSTTNTSTYGYAQVHLLNLDTDTNTLTFSETSTLLAGQSMITSLARCCCCATSRPLLVGSYDINQNYNINVFAPDLSQLYASTLLGTDIRSVAWNCQGENTHLAAAGVETISNSSQELPYAATYQFSALNGTLSGQNILYHY
jgi:hypothetical protein